MLSTLPTLSSTSIQFCSLLSSLFTRAEMLRRKYLTLHVEIGYPFTHISPIYNKLGTAQVGAISKAQK